ncbi:hypothetical protein F66182_1132 [Fusarium sp. NRRL 66182]|nr:hypothetical protein F66182_1132 [Fusarium sp. NRRL 66182]
MLFFYHDDVRMEGIKAQEANVMPADQIRRTGNRHNTRSDRDPPSAQNLSLNSACFSTTNPTASTQTCKAVSSLHSSEAGPSTPTTRPPRSTFEDSAVNRIAVEARIGIPSSQYPEVVDVNSHPATPQAPVINNQLVDAISRNIAQQLQMLSIKDGATQTQHSLKQPAPQLSDSLDNESRSPSQKAALDCFTQELHRFAEQSGAKGKLPISTPTPPHSTTSLHTISALVPFRSEFKAAGLAVTSNDQLRYFSHPVTSGKAQAATDQASQVRIKGAHLTQMDRDPGCPSSSTEIPFPVTKEMDEWRYAMVDPDQPRGRKLAAVAHESQSWCPPCHPGDIDRWRD